MNNFPVLVDTNMLLRSVQPSHPAFNQATLALSTLKLDGCTLHLVPQNFYEFWVVATRPVLQNGLGMLPLQAALELHRLKSFFVFLNDPPSLYAEWERLVVTSRVSGKEAHDAMLVAAMLHHGLTHILTFNVNDFARYAIEGIVVIDPASF